MLRLTVAWRKLGYGSHDGPKALESWVVCPLPLQ